MVTASSSRIVPKPELSLMLATPELTILVSATEKFSLGSPIKSLIMGTELVFVAPLNDPAVNMIVPAVVVSVSYTHLDVYKRQM